MNITITEQALTKALGAENSRSLSKYIKTIQQALTQYHLDKADPKKEQAARNTLMSALYDWKTKKPKEFEKYDKVSDGAVRKLSVQCGLYSYRPPPPNAVLLHGELRQAPTQRREPRVTPLSTDLVSTLHDYAHSGTRVAVLVIDLYGDDYQAQGLNARYGSNPATVKDNIIKLLKNTRTEVGNGVFEHLPVYICAKSTTASGQEIVSDFRNAISSVYKEVIRSGTNSVVHNTGLRQKLQANSVTDVFVTGFDANMCVAASIFGTGGTGVAYQPGLLDFGFNVVTSRFVLASGGSPLTTRDGWPYMGKCNV